MPHTSGPWDYRFEDLRGGRYHTVQRPGHDIESIDLRADENGEADAKLIAAAPDLFEALSDVLNSLSNVSGAMPTHLAHEISVAKAALAKARGEATKE